MRTIVHRLAATCCMFLPAPAIAAEMSAAEIKELITGKSVYLELAATATAGAGQGVIYYNADGTALYRTAKGVMWHGTWVDQRQHGLHRLEGSTEQRLHEVRQAGRYDHHHQRCDWPSPRQSYEDGRWKCREL